MRFLSSRLQRRFSAVMILPVAALLLAAGFSGFLLLRDLLLDQWRESATLKLERAAHIADMHLARIKEAIRLFEETPVDISEAAFRRLVLEQLMRRDGVVEVRLDWERATPSGGGPHAGRPGGEGRGRRMGSYAGARIRGVTPPRFDPRDEHGTFEVLAEFLDESGGILGRLAAVVDFDFIFRHVIESAWWQSHKAFLVDETGRVLISRTPSPADVLGGNGDALEQATREAMGRALSGTLLGAGMPPREVSGFHRLREAPWFLVLIAPGREVLAPILSFRDGYLLFSIGLVVLIGGLIAWVMGRLAAEIRQVAREAIRLAHGEFGDPLPVRRGDELGEMILSFNHMSRQLRERLELKEALRLAEEVQRNLLPAAPPAIPGLDIAARSLYCQETGGDYYDFIVRGGEVGRRSWCVAVGDVVGHGIPAALLMTTARAFLRAELGRPVGLAAALAETNRLLCRDTAASGSFVTLAVLEISTSPPGFGWAGAGHDPPFFYDAAAGRVRRPRGATGVALGVMEEAVYGVTPLSGTRAGDVILIGTDGIWESRDPGAERYGKGRLAEVVARHAALSAEGILQAVLEDVMRFRGPAPMEDDVTLAVVKVVSGPWAEPAPAGRANGRG